MNCFKCKVPLVKSADEEHRIKPTQVLGGFASKGMRHTIYRCPSCGKARAVSGEVLL